MPTPAPEIGVNGELMRAARWLVRRSVGCADDGNKANCSTLVRSARDAGGDRDRGSA